MKRLSQYRLIAFGILFFLVAHSIESTIFPLENYFLHRNYLPSIGLCLAIVLVLKPIFEMKFLIRIRKLLIPIYLVILSVFSWQTAEIWASSTVMTINDFNQQPGSVRANMQMTQLLVNNGKFLESLEVNKQILDAQPQMGLRSAIQRFYI